MPKPTSAALDGRQFALRPLLRAVSATRASPSLGLECSQRVAAEAEPLGIGGIYVTGGESFLLPDVAENTTTRSLDKADAIAPDSDLLAHRE